MWALTGSSGSVATSAHPRTYEELRAHKKMDPRAKDSLYAIVKSGRELMKILPTSSASLVTLMGYDREIQRLSEKYNARQPSQLWEAITSTTRSKRTYHRRLAALRHHIKHSLDQLVPLQDTQQKLGNTIEWISTVHSIKNLISLNEFIENSRGICPIAEPAKRHSKRQDIRGLPDNWREQMLSEFANSKYRTDFMIAAITGCRPAELEKGIEIKATATSITLKLEGAKVKEQQGQPWREIQYAITENSSALIKSLHKEIFDQFGDEPILAVTESKVNFTSAIRRVGKKLWPRRNSEITPYSLRHQAASDFKRFLSEDEVSIALGHTVDETKRLYGQAQMSSGASALAPEKVTAARAVRTTRKLRPQQPMKPTN
jgi:integrase